jgi:hypothetical protein
MPQDIALQAKAPRSDVGEILEFGNKQARDRQVLEAGKMTNEVNRMKLDEATQQHDAMQKFRELSAKGDDEGASDAISAYPELQEKLLFESWDGMGRKAFMKEQKRINLSAELARQVKNIPNGSPEKKAMWDYSMDKLAEEGMIDPLLAKHWQKMGPYDLLIDLALTQKQWVDKYGETKKTAKSPEDIELKRAQIEEVKARTEKLRTPKETDRLNVELKQAQIEKLKKQKEGKSTNPAKDWANGQKMITDFARQQGLEKGEEYWLGQEEGAKEKAEAKVEAYRAKVERMFPEPPVSPAPLPSTPGNQASKASRELPSGQIGAKDNPAEVSTPRQAEALPSGAWFKGPDGKLWVKR